MSNNLAPKELSPSQRVLFALKEARTKLEAAERAKVEPIAIVGMGCRFPGGANDPAAFWQHLKEGTNFIREVPADRWDIDAYFDPDPEVTGKMYTRWGGFLNTRIDEFDAHFFKLTPREVVRMDPQQRLLLEVSWETLEHAGIAPDTLSESKTGVFVGINASDYAQMQSANGNGSQTNAYTFTGTTFSVAAGRIAYLLGLQGPTFALDTACSSSLVSIHLACQSLRNQECRLALAGGVNLMLSPQTTVVLARMRALAPDGRCKTFDAAADGYGRGEGCGMVALKRLSDAIADGDQIHALIRGSAINHDGSSSGLTVPNGPAQQQLIQTALANAKVTPEQLSYVEVHGTGTALGDPIEVEALGAALGKRHTQPLMLGSVKTDIGHLEAAAGVAGLIKVVLTLQHQTILPHRHLSELNPAIDWENLPITIPTQSIPWQVPKDKRRLAGLSSFGMSGTNAHTILEESPQAAVFQKEYERSLHLLTLSAKQADSLQQQAQRYEQWIAANPNLTLPDICFTANTGRSHFPYRLSILANSTAQLRERLSAYCSGQEPVGVFPGQNQSSSRPKITFLFTGQGSQYVDMGRQLYETSPIFRQTLDECDRLLQPYMETALLEVLYGKTDGIGHKAETVGDREKETENREQRSIQNQDSEGRIHQTQFTQPAIFAVEYALAQVWKSWGIEPDYVMGHSIGEYVAACIAGVFSLEDGLKLIAERGRLMQTLPKGGKMVAILTGEATVLTAIESCGVDVVIAAVNGPQNTVISGDGQAVGEVVAALIEQGLECKSLTVSHAFHSPLMAPMLSNFEQVASEVIYARPQISIVSNLTGQWASEELATPEHWCRHVLEPVKFSEGMTTLHQEGCELFIEIGAKPILAGMGRRCVLSTSSQWLLSLHPNQDDWSQMLRSLSQLYIQGIAVDWARFDQGYGRQKVTLPTYPFQRQRYWFEKIDSKHPPSPLNASVGSPTSIAAFLEQGNTSALTELLLTADTFETSEQALLPKVLDSLAQQYQEQLRSAAVQDWLYEWSWEAQPRQTSITPGQPGSWLILADRQGVGAAIAETLHSHGQTCRLAYISDREGIGDAIAPSTADISYLRPSQPEAFDHLLQDLEASETPLKGIIHLWSLDVPAVERLTIPTIEQAQLDVCGSTLHLVQAMIKHQSTAMPRLWLVTRGAKSVLGESVGVAQSSLWGLGKIIVDEQPQLWGGIVDLDPEAPADEIASLLNEVLATEDEDHLAFRQGHRYALRLVRSTRTRVLSQVPIQAEGTYLITGGLGALGLKLAQRMVERGAKHLVLVGRRQPKPEVQAILQQMIDQGAQVRVAQADIAQQTDVVQVLMDIKADFPSLRGIVHTAGVLDDGILERQTWAGFTRVMAPKINGAWYLHTLTQDLDLDFFVLFSSATSFLGSPGQGNYASANAFLDGLAHYRQAQGLPGLSINWGPWAEIGMTARMGEREQSRMKARGVELMAPNYGMQALELLLQQDTAQAGVFAIQWSEWLRQFPQNHYRPYLKEMAEEVAAAATHAATDTTSTQSKDRVFDQLLATPSDQREALLTPYLQRQVAKILQIEVENLSVQENLVDRGMDSLMVMEVVNALQSHLQIMFYPREFYERPKLEALSQYLIAEFEQAHGADVSSAELSQLNGDTSESMSAEKALILLQETIKAVQTQNNGGNRRPGPIFVLSGPRSGSTLLRVMLAGHPALFSPPELHLLPFETMNIRQEELARSYLGEGIQRAFMDVMNLNGSTSQAIVDEITRQNLPIQQVYAVLQALADTRQLVDKSPTYAMNRKTLERAEQLFEGPKYLYLSRHPYAAIESFARMRMDKLMDFKGITSNNAYQIAEEVWANTNQNILDFLAQSVEPERYHHVTYEALMQDPEAVMGGVCEFLHVPFVRDLLQPYQGERMTDGVHTQSISIGDPNFSKYKKLEPQLADAWRTIRLPHALNHATQLLAAELQYELPLAETNRLDEYLSKAPSSVPMNSPVESSAMQELWLEVRGQQLCVCSWGATTGPIVLCLHGLLEQGAAWETVAIPLVEQGYRVIAPDLRGHGRSPRLQGGYSVIDLVADIDVLIEQLADCPITLVGHSLGSIVAAMLASARPHKINTLVLVETVLPAEGSEAETADQLATHLNYLINPPQHPVFTDIKAAATRLRQATPMMSAAISLKLADRITEICPGGVRWTWDSLLKTRTLMSASGFPYSKPQYLKLLHYIQVPTTLVYGDRSNLNRVADLADQKSAMPRAQRIVLSGGHNLHVDAPLALADAISQAITDKISAINFQNLTPTSTNRNQSPL